MNFVFLDDNTAFLEQIKNTVYNKYDDFEFECFSNTEKFIEYVTHNSDKLSGVFIDIVLDNTNGMEIARQVNKINSDIKIVEENKEKERKDNIRGYVVETRGRLMSLASEINTREIEVKKDPNLTQKQADDIVEYLHRIRVGLYKLHDEE